MTNYARLFAEAVRDSIRDYYSQDESRMTAGYWQIKLNRRGPWIPARTYLCDHEPGNPDNKLDRPVMVAEIAGDDADPLDVFGSRDRRELVPQAGLTVEQEYQYLCADMHHAQEFRPDDPLAQPHRAVDLTKMEPLF